MIIKSAGDGNSRLPRIRAGIERSSGRERRFWEAEQRKAMAGDRHERNMGYELARAFAESDTVHVINDLRMERNGIVCQIDHLVVCGTLDCFVIETKGVGSGVAVSPDGEFVRFHAGRPVGMASPIRQADRHIEFLETLFASGRVRPPTGLGLPSRPVLHGYAVVPNDVRVARPPAGSWKDDSRLLKMEAIIERVREVCAGSGFVNLGVLHHSVQRRVEIERFVRDLAALHLPLASRGGSSPRSSAVSGFVPAGFFGREPPA